MAKQTIELPASIVDISSRRDGRVRWQFPNNGKIPIIDALKAQSSDARFFHAIQLTRGGSISLSIGRDQTVSVSNTDDLSDKFETDGGIDITISGTTYSFELAGADTVEPYTWTPTNSTDVTTIFNALTTSTVATLVIRDGPLNSGFKLGFGGKTYNKVQFGGKTYNKMVFNGKTY